MFPFPPSMCRIVPESFNISEEQPAPPVVDGSIWGDFVFAPLKGDSGARIRRGSSLMEAQIPFGGPMDTESSLDEGYANRFCETDTTSAYDGCRYAPRIQAASAMRDGLLNSTSDPPTPQDDEGGLNFRAA